MINRIAEYTKMAKPSAKATEAFIEDVGIIMHEIGHMVSTNIDPKLRANAV